MECAFPWPLAELVAEHTALHCELYSCLVSGAYWEENRGLLS